MQTGSFEYQTPSTICTLQRESQTVIKDASARLLWAFRPWLPLQSSTCVWLTSQMPFPITLLNGRLNDRFSQPVIQDQSDRGQRLSRQRALLLCALVSTSEDTEGRSPAAARVISGHQSDRLPLCAFVPV